MRLPATSLIARLAPLRQTKVITILVATLLVIATVWAAVWGTTDGVASVVQQHRLVMLAPASAPLLFGLNSSAIYVGVAVGGSEFGRRDRALSTR